MPYICVPLGSRSDCIWMLGAVIHQRGFQIVLHWEWSLGRAGFVFPYGVSVGSDKASVCRGGGGRRGFPCEDRAVPGDFGRDFGRG